LGNSLFTAEFQIISAIFKNICENEANKKFILLVDEFVKSSSHEGQNKFNTFNKIIIIILLFFFFLAFLIIIYW